MKRALIAKNSLTHCLGRTPIIVTIRNIHLSVISGFSFDKRGLRSILSIVGKTNRELTYARRFTQV
jgi:hypothetical protein